MTSKVILVLNASGYGAAWQAFPIICATGVPEGG